MIGDGALVSPLTDPRAANPAYAGGKGATLAAAWSAPVCRCPTGSSSRRPPTGGSSTSTHSRQRVAASHSLVGRLLHFAPCPVVTVLVKD